MPSGIATAAPSEREPEDPPLDLPAPGEDVDARRDHADRLDRQAEVPPETGGVVEHVDEHREADGPAGHRARAGRRTTPPPSRPRSASARARPARARRRPRSPPRPRRTASSQTAKSPRRGSLAAGMPPTGPPSHRQRSRCSRVRTPSALVEDLLLVAQDLPLIGQDLPLVTLDLVLVGQDRAPGWPGWSPG